LMLTWQPLSELVSQGIGALGHLRRHLLSQWKKDWREETAKCYAKGFVYGEVFLEDPMHDCHWGWRLADGEHFEDVEAVPAVC